MREIKFRVYDQINKVMYTPELDKEICNLWAIPKAQGGVLSYPNGVLMQYTGLKDNNGIEIYEGDIVDFGGLGIVKYDEDRFYVDCGNVHTRVSKQHKVIGNIYENPELLELR